MPSNNLKCNVMLFAAGLGTRLRPHTNAHPKPVIPLLGYAMGYYLFPYFKHLQISNFVVNTFHLPDQIHQLYSSINKQIKFSDEKDFIKGSAGGLKQAQPLLATNTENILVCNSDEILFTKENDFLFKALEQHEAQQALATLVVMRHPLAGSKFGAIWCDDSNRVQGIGKESPSARTTPWHFVGLQIISPKIFQHLPENVESNIFYDVLVNLLKDELVQIYPIQADWYETGNVPDYLEAKKIISDKLKTQSEYQSHFQSLNQLPRSQISDLT